MGIIDRLTLKNLFKTARTPSQNDYWSWLDSYIHKNDKISADQVAGLSDALAGKLDTEASDNILKAVQDNSTTMQALKDQTVLKYNDAALTPAADSITLADQYSGVEHLWKKSDAPTDGVLTKNISGTVRTRQYEVADIRWWGVTDGPNQGAKIQKALDDLANSDVRELAFFGLKEISVEIPLVVKKGDLKIDGKNCVLSASSDIVVWNLDNKNSVWITNFISGNTTDKQTWIKAVSSHNLRLTDCRFDGMKLGIHLVDCYYTKINAVRFQSVHQAFIFEEATNGFSVTNVNIHGAGIPSIILNTTTGGRISGCGFEDASGRLVLSRVFGIEISGNYFEGYNENKVDSYIQLGTTTNYEDVSGIAITGNLFYTGAMQAIKMLRVGGISITGNAIGTLHAVNLVGDGGCTQRNINYAGNSWRYNPSLQVGIPVEQSAEIVGEFDGGSANISPDFNFPVIFQPQIFHARAVENNAHQIGATTVDEHGFNAFFHSFKVNGVKYDTFLNGSWQAFSRSFSANENFQIPWEPFAFGITTGTLVIRDGANKSAMFVWCRNINNAAKTGSFKEVYNDLGVSVSNPEGLLSITNSSTPNFLLGEFKL